jgi:hypothetical protein
MQLLDYWLEQRLKFYENIGIPRAKLHVLNVPDADRAFYSKGTYDIEYEFPFGVQELEGVAYRTDYDLMAHQNGSGKPLEYFRRGDEGEICAACGRAERGCRSHFARVNLRSVRRGDRHGREGEVRNADGDALSSADGADQGRRVPIAQEQAGARRESARSAHVAEAAHDDVL